MLRHNFLLIYRNFKRFKSTFFINLIGLSTGMACALLIYLWVSDELSIDKFHEKESRLYQVIEHHQQAGKINTIEFTAGLLAETLAEELPEVEYAASVIKGGDITLALNEEKIKSQGYFVGKDFFQMFSYDLLQGDKAQVLADKNAIVISAELAMRFFNTTENVLGKTLYLDDYPLIISGIFAGSPPNSSLQFDFTVSYEILKEFYPQLVEWGNYNPYTYLVLQKDTDISLFNEKIRHFMDSKKENMEYRTLFARPYSKGYLYGKYDNGKQAGGRIEYIYLFSIIACFILLIACINFMNLSTAKASRRVKEVGIKKAIGAGRVDLIRQYIGESLLMAFLSLLVAVILVELLLPQFNSITGKQLYTSVNLSVIFSCLGITAITGLIAGSYPALYLSAFNPTTVLKGKHNNSSTGELWARKGLVVFQFAVSIILIVSVWVVYKQIDYVQNKNLGYNKANVITLPLEGKASKKPGVFLREIEKIPGVVDASTMQHDIASINDNTYDFSWPGKPEGELINFVVFGIGMDLIEILDFTIISGRSFSRDHLTDSSAVILNQATADLMGLPDPVGATVNLWGQDRLVIGVVKNFHFESLHEAVKPLVMILEDRISWVVVKIEEGKERETLAGLEDFYLDFNPGYPFGYKFVDADYQSLYQAEQRVSTLSKYFAGLAILISCLGLFGLAAFTAEKRSKEIGIRKILGSSEFGIVYLLSSDFTKMVIIAIAIALPVSYFTSAKWLESFAYRIDLEWWYFVGAGFMALFVAWFTVGLQTLKAARVNPVKCLQDE